MRARSEAAGALALLGILAAVSFGHLGWGGEGLLGRLNRNLFVLAGGRFAATRPTGPEPLTRMLTEENERLHQLLALRSRLPGRTQAALVTRREPDAWWSRMDVEFAVAEGAPPRGTAMVLTNVGLIGTLESADLVMARQGGGSSTYCRGKVTLLSSPETQLTVVVGEQEAPYLLEGRGGSNFALRPVTSGAEMAIAPGDLVRTSGLGKLFSKGLQVAQVDKDTGRAAFHPMSSTPAEVLLWWK